MINRVLSWALAAAILLGVGAYTLGGLNEKGFELAEVSRDICYSGYGINPDNAPVAPAAIRSECTRPIRDYEADEIWRYISAAAVGATAAALIVGGLVILFRRRRSGGGDPVRSGS